MKLFEEVMSHRGFGIDGWHNYAGPDWSGWYCGPAHNRDSEILSISNFEVALKLLGGEQKNKVTVRECNHWAVGWFKQIMVKKGSKAAGILAEIEKKIDGYPILNEDDYSKREQDAIDKSFDFEQEGFMLEFFKLLGFKNPKLPARGKHKDEINLILYRAYFDDCMDSGYENGYLDVERIKNYLKRDGAYEVRQMAKEGSRLARAMIAKGLIKA